MISILLSTFNGCAYLPTLLDSLISQDSPDIRILIRDDGSTDDTPDVLSAYAEKYDQIHVDFGSNKGANASFYELLARLPDDTDYLAFCDQDDFWEKGKISRAVELISEQRTGGPLMYCSRLTVADADLKAITLSPSPIRGSSFENSLVENIATGATIVLNREAVHLVQNHVPDMLKLEMYDWLIYQTLSAMGSVLYDDQPFILSRQHSENVVGLSFGLRWWKSKYRFIGSGEKSAITAQAEEFRRLFHDHLDDRNRQILDQFLIRTRDRNIFRRFRYAMEGNVFRQKGVDDLLLKLRIVLGKL